MRAGQRWVIWPDLIEQIVFYPSNFQRCCPENYADNPTLCRECYLAVDALAKLRTPTPEAAPLLLAVMAHLAQGLDLRPLRPALHLNLLSTPPSQLIKLASAIKVRRMQPLCPLASAPRQPWPVPLVMQHSRSLRRLVSSHVLVHADTHAC